jgi:hypothetical protein
VGFTEKNIPAQAKAHNAQELKASIEEILKKRSHPKSINGFVE